MSMVHGTCRTDADMSMVCGTCRADGNASTVCDTRYTDGNVSTVCNTHRTDASLSLGYQLRVPVKNCLQPLSQRSKCLQPLNGVNASFELNIGDMIFFILDLCFHFIY